MHENWDIISWDRGRAKCVLRQFHVEGFVNQYILDSLSSDMFSIQETISAGSEA